LVKRYRNLDFFKILDGAAEYFSADVVNQDLPAVPGKLIPEITVGVKSAVGIGLNSATVRCASSGARRVKAGAAVHGDGPGHEVYKCWTSTIAIRDTATMISRRVNPGRTESNGMAVNMCAQISNPMYAS